MYFIFDSGIYTEEYIKYMTQLQHKKAHLNKTPPDFSWDQKKETRKAEQKKWEFRPSRTGKPIWGNPNLL